MNIPVNISMELRFTCDLLHPLSSPLHEVVAKAAMTKQTRVKDLMRFKKKIQFPLNTARDPLALGDWISFFFSFNFTLYYFYIPFIQQAWGRGGGGGKNIEKPGVPLTTSQHTSHKGSTIHKMSTAQDTSQPTNYITRDQTSRDQKQKATNPQN